MKIYFRPIIKPLLWLSGDERHDGHPGFARGELLRLGSLDRLHACKVLVAHTLITVGIPEHLRITKSPFLQGPVLTHGC